MCLAKHFTSKDSKKYVENKKLAISFDVISESSLFSTDRPLTEFLRYALDIILVGVLRFF